MKTLTIIFQPEGKRINVKLGTTILEAAIQAGVGINSECGGKGTCGKCRVIVSNEARLAKLSKSERSLLSPDEIRAGYRLACQVTPKRSLTVQLPEESRIGIRRIQVSGFEHFVTISPSIRKHHLTLVEPSLQDPLPDLERLMKALKERYGYSQLEIDDKLLLRLPDILRSAMWDVTATVWNDQIVIALEPGDMREASYGFAVDVGTSKIVSLLVNLNDGKIEAVGSIENPQLRHGEDIMSRITFTMTHENGLSEMQRLVIAGINTTVSQALRRSSISSENVYEFVVVGNTAMHHMLLGIQPKYLALAPYSPGAKSPLNLKARELHLIGNDGAIVHVLPNIAGFVGADAVADVIATGIHEENQVSLLLDIGTNTEVFVGNRDGLLSCSCASGPAFEGAHIKHGMKAISGAIERVKIDPVSLEVDYKTVDEARPMGICGSGILDCVAELFKAGVLDFRGRFKKIRAKRVRRTRAGSEFILVSREDTPRHIDITVTQGDIDQILLAKAAIHTGCAIIMRSAGIKQDQLDKILLAGAFGTYINAASAVFVGMLPDVPIERVRFVGNTALSGAKMCLISREMRESARSLSERVRYIELGAHPDFQKEFMKSLYLPNRDLDLYPSVKQVIWERAESNMKDYLSH